LLAIILGSHFQADFLVDLVEVRGGHQVAGVIFIRLQVHIGVTHGQPEAAILEGIGGGQADEVVHLVVTRYRGVKILIIGVLGQKAEGTGGIDRVFQQGGLRKHGAGLPGNPGDFGPPTRRDGDVGVEIKAGRDGDAEGTQLLRPLGQYPHIALGEISGLALGIKRNALLHSLFGFFDPVEGGQGQARLELGLLGHLGLRLGLTEIIQGFTILAVFGGRNPHQIGGLSRLVPGGQQILQDRFGFFGLVEGQQGVGQH